jgi:hypothetical protein
MRVKIWEKTSPYRALDVLEVAQPYSAGDDSPYGPIIEVLPAVAFHEAGIDQSVAVVPRGEWIAEPENSIFKTPTHYRKITFYPIYSGGRHPWDKGALEKPSYEIMEGVTIENVTSIVSPKAFAPWQNEGYLSRRQFEDFGTIKYALVHRYSTEHPRVVKYDRASQQLIGKLNACLLLVRPMRRRHAGIVTGTLGEDGLLDPQEFNVSEPVEVPHIQKFFYLREQDVEVFRRIAPRFLEAFKEGEDSYEPFRMALQLFEQGYVGSKLWKVRHILWWSAMEALFGNDPTRLTIRALSLFGDKDISKGEATSIYEPEDVPSFADHRPRATIGDTLEDLYNVRNMAAHGRKVPSDYLTPVPHMFGQAFGRAEILAEAASFIIRKTAIRILASNLLVHYTDVRARENYWRHYGLSKSQAKKKMRELAAKRRLQEAERSAKSKTTKGGSGIAMTESEKRESRRAALKGIKVRPLPD